MLVAGPAEVVLAGVGVVDRAGKSGLHPDPVPGGVEGDHDPSGLCRVAGIPSDRAGIYGDGGVGEGGGDHVGLFVIDGGVEVRT